MTGLQRKFFWDGSVKDLLLRGAAGHWIHDFVATFRVNDRPIYMALCSQLVWGGLLDTGSRPSVVKD